MLVGALGASAISQLYQSFKAQGTNSDGDNDKTTTKTATTATAATATAGSTPPITDAATKLITDLKSLLLNLQASNGTATAGTSSTPLQQSLQSVSDDLQKAGGSGHHHHHHAAASSLDAGTSTSGSSTLAGSTSQLAQAVNAYASSNLAKPSAASALLTA